MKPERWQRVDALFEAVLERPPEERSRFLDEACGGDASLRREVDTLLAVDGEAEGFLSGGVTVVRAAVGERIGPYRLERLIGSGGMGVVYSATRADDAYERRVAIKLLQGGLLSASLVRRFHGERQILASLDHPSIARLLDGGATATGRPYLVMEYIDGRPIDEYCDAHRLTVRQRLELFRQVCAAVHYAHQNLVVHRDLKPSNILITQDGAPRLLDFGIAKLLDPERFPITVEATTAGLRPMTPQWASPEQVRGGTITTASDVYSLGVLLYFLLTGRMPHATAGLSPNQLDRLVTEVEPLKPSTAVSRSSETPDAASFTAAETVTPEVFARRRGTWLQQLRRQLAGDLDNVVLMALRKEPARRYGSVEQLSEDLRRHLEGLPVLARHDAFGYQLKTFLRRYRWAVALAGLVLALVLAFAAAMARQAAQTALQRDRAEQERARAEQERERAEQERERAEQVSDFLVDLFTGVSPWKARGEDVTAREVLDRGARKIEVELSGQPEVKASLQDAIGTVYLHLAYYEEAESMLLAALAEREARLGPTHLDVAESLGHVATLHRRQGRLSEAEPLYGRALEIRERALGGDHVDVAEIVRELAKLHRSQGRYADAEEAARRALEIYRRTLGPDHPEVASSLQSLAGAAARQGRLVKAQAALEEALVISVEALGEVHTLTAGILNNLGNIRLELGAPGEAEACFERALASWQKILGEEHPNVALALLGLASIAKVRDQPEAEERFLLRTLEIFEGTVGADHQLAANSRFKLGSLSLRRGRLGEAEPLLLRSLEIREGNLGPGHPWTAESLCGLAELRRLEGRLAEAVSLCDRVRDISRQHPRHSALEEMPRVCGTVYRAAGKPSEAQAMEGLTQAAPPGAS